MGPLGASKLAITFALSNSFTLCGTRQVVYQSKSISLLQNRLLMLRGIITIDFSDTPNSDGSKASFPLSGAMCFP